MISPVQAAVQDSCKAILDRSIARCSGTDPNEPKGTTAPEVSFIVPKTF
jgi:hypothetical protein